MQQTQIRLPRFKTIDDAIRKLEKKIEHTNSEDVRARIQARIDALKERKEHIERRPITDRDLDILSKIAEYRFLPASLIVRLIPGARRRIEDRLQFLWLKQLVNRFQTARNVGEFNYYLDNQEALDLLTTRRGRDADTLPHEEVRNNRVAQYARAAQKGEEGKLMFLRHELMISRFHAVLELACAHSKGAVTLADWRQGTELWQSIEVPRLVFDRDLQQYRSDRENTETLPHRPDAFFTLSFPNQDKADVSFFYEADRKTMTLADMRRKLRTHFHYVVAQKKHQEHYHITRIRAVLIETITGEWAERLLETAADPRVSGQPSPLFWFTTSERFELTAEVHDGGRLRKLPKFLRQPQIIFAPIWATPKDYQQSVWYKLTEP